MIQGRSVRVILKKSATAEALKQAPGMPELEMEETAPRFEDAFIDLLGGAGTSESPLGAILHTVDGSPDETVIEAKQLTKKFGDFAATDHVNFAVKRGEIFGLLGPNGAGKSTTFKMMCGLLVPTSVSIWATWRRNFRCTATSPSNRTCASSPGCTACAAARRTIKLIA